MQQAPRTRQIKADDSLKDVQSLPAKIFEAHDGRQPEFVERVRRQCQSLKGAPVETEVLRFTEEAAAHIEGWSS